MKIIVNTSSYPRYQGDGVAPFVKSISEAIKLHNHEIEVVAPYDIEVKPDPSNQVKVHRYKYIWPKKWHILGHARSLRADVKLRFLVPLLLPFFLIASIYNLIKHAKKMGAEVIHNHWVLPNGVSAAIASKILKIPFIISLHGSDIFMAERNFVFRAVAKWVFSKSSFVTACSQELCDRAKKINPNINIIILPWGADPEIFKPLPNRNEIREKYGWGADEIIIVSLGRFVYKKGFLRLLSIIPDLYAADPKIHLTIGGSGPLEAEFKSYIEQHELDGIISLPGQIPWNEVPEFLAAADIFVLPSQRDRAGNLDGLPTVLLEAMACELSCVASDIGGVNLVINHLSNGWLVEPNEQNGFLNAISSLLEDKQLRESLAHNARHSIITEFNWDHVACEIENLLLKSTYKPQKKRLGQIYRKAYLQNMNMNQGGMKVLDIGCHDDDWLSNLDAEVRVGIDIKPLASKEEIQVVAADGCNIPFPSGSFDVVYLLDVIEHVEKDNQLIHESLRVLKTNGKMILTTPHIDIKLFPPFLTGWISKKWGHTLRRGYSPEALKAFIDETYQIDTHLLNAKWYRMLYLPLRLILPIFPKCTEKIINFTVKQESKNLIGEKGYILLEIRKQPNKVD